MLRLGNGAGYIGPWRADMYGSGCDSWDKDATDLDDWILNMARACSVMALVFGSLLALFAFFNQCLCPLPFTQPILDISGAGVQVSLALTWPMVRTAACDQFGGCIWDDGATSLLLSQVFYFCASVFTRCMREPRYKRKQNEQPKDDKAAREREEAEKKAAEEKKAKEKEEGDNDATEEGEDAGHKV